MAAIVCTALLLMLLGFSDRAMEAALASARCFAHSVMPALFPMMVLGKMMPDRTKAEHSIAGCWVRTGLFAWAAGSPAAARRAADARGGMTQAGWESLLCLTGVMSPLFFTGTLAGLLGSAQAGRRLLVSHWLGAAGAAAVWRLLARKKTQRLVHEETEKAEQMRLTDAIDQSARSMLCVCGAMMAFSVAAGLVRSVLAALFPVWTERHAEVLAAGWALMEIGSGSAAVIACMAQPHALLGALCGFGGLSLWLQNLLFLPKSIRPARLLCMRAVHGAVSYGIVRVWAWLSPF